MRRGRSSATGGRSHALCRGSARWHRQRRTTTHSTLVAAALKDAALSALVAFGLFFFMIGLRTDQGPTGALEITTRFHDACDLVGVVFAGSVRCAR